MSLENICLKVKHNGKAKVVGKMALIAGGYVFYHAHKTSQRHRLLDALAIDVAVVDWLDSRNVETVHYYDVEQQTLRIARLKDFLEKGIRKPWGNRDRYYLPLEFWAETKRWYPEPPWASLEVTVGE